MTGINSVRATGHNNEVSGRQTPVAGQVERNNRIIQSSQQTNWSSPSGITSFSDSYEKLIITMK
jgi:hypothetical protein